VKSKQGLNTRLWLPFILLLVSSFLRNLRSVGGLVPRDSHLQYAVKFWEKCNRAPMSSRNFSKIET